MNMIYNYLSIQLKASITCLLFLITCLIQAQTPVTESFDGTTFPPSGWAANAVVGPINWSRATSASGGGFSGNTVTPKGGAAFAFYDIWNTNASGDYATLISPSFSLVSRPSGSAGYDSVVFWMYRTTAWSGYLDRLETYINTSTSLTGATLLGTVYAHIGGTPVVGAAGWYRYAFSIAASFNTATNYVIFKGYSDWYNNLALDEVSWLSWPNSCSGTPTTGTISAGSTTLNSCNSNQLTCRSRSYG